MSNENRNDSGNIGNLHKNPKSVEFIKEKVSKTKKSWHQEGVTKELILKTKRIKNTLNF